MRHRDNSYAPCTALATVNVAGGMTCGTHLLQPISHGVHVFQTVFHAKELSQPTPSEIHLTDSYELFSYLGFRLLVRFFEHQKPVMAHALLAMSLAGASVAPRKPHLLTA